MGMDGISIDYQIKCFVLGLKNGTLLSVAAQGLFFKIDGLLHWVNTKHLRITRIVTGVLMVNPACANQCPPKSKGGDNGLPGVWEVHFSKLWRSPFRLADDGTSFIDIYRSCTNIKRQVVLKPEALCALRTSATCVPAKWLAVCALNDGFGFK